MQGGTTEVPHVKGDRKQICINVQNTVHIVYKLNDLSELE